VSAAGSRHRPAIGITTSSTVISIEEEPLDIRYSPTMYDEAVWAAGGIPVHLPPLPPEGGEHLVDLVEGLILSGGEDLDPRTYRRPATDGAGQLDRERDDAELGLAQRALSESLPILGVCRGIQVLNVALGGSLVEDLPSSGPQNHRVKHVPTVGPIHAIVLEPLSRLAAAFGCTHLEVNSAHHQAVETLGEGLVVSARSPDGIVEGVELDRDGTWVVGVQWHPEAMQAADGLQRRLFRALVAQAAISSASRRRPPATRP
jgi:putative glutamine amidotransferase